MIYEISAFNWFVICVIAAAIVFCFWTWPWVAEENEKLNEDRLENEEPDWLKFAKPPEPVHKIITIGFGGGGGGSQTDWYESHQKPTRTGNYKVKKNFKKEDMKGFLIADAWFDVIVDAWFNKENGKKLQQQKFEWLGLYKDSTIPTTITLGDRVDGIDPRKIS